MGGFDGLSWVAPRSRGRHFHWWGQNPFQFRFHSGSSGDEFKLQNVINVRRHGNRQWCTAEKWGFYLNILCFPLISPTIINSNWCTSFTFSSVHYPSIKDCPSIRPSFIHPSILRFRLFWGKSTRKRWIGGLLECSSTRWLSDKFVDFKSYFEFNDLEMPFFFLFPAIIRGIIS